jgi:hypothetical protein
MQPILSTKSHGTHRVLRKIIAQLQFGIFQKRREFSPQCERVMASLTQCAGGQSNQQCQLDLTANIIQQKRASFLTLDMSRRNTQRFAASFTSTANNSSIRATIGVATGSRGFTCTASKNCLLAVRIRFRYSSLLIAVVAPC